MPYRQSGEWRRHFLAQDFVMRPQVIDVHTQLNGRIGAVIRLIDSDEY